jgi:hypothetical protein
MNFPFVDFNVTSSFRTLVYKFNVLAIARVLVRVALCKYKIVSTGNGVC